MTIASFWTIIVFLGFLFAMYTSMYTFTTANKESSNQLRTLLRKDQLQGFCSKFMKQS